MQRPREVPRDEPLLRQARAGQPLDAFVFDAHGHSGAWFNFHIPRSDPGSILEVMDRCGVRWLALSAMLGIGPDFQTGNAEIAAATAAYPDRLIGYVCVNPNYPPAVLEAELERWLGKHPGMRGIKLHPSVHRYPVNGPAYRVAFEAAVRHRVPVLSHTWGEGEEATFCGPALFASLAEAYPGVPIVLGHAGGTIAGCRAAVEVAQRYPNLYLETCGSQQGAHAVEFMVGELGAERVLYGSDVCFLALPYGLGRVAYARLSSEEKRRVLGLNAARIFGVSPAA